jgi:hypothetical protein
MSDDTDEIIREAVDRAGRSRSVAVAIASLVSFALGGVAWALLSRL